MLMASYIISIVLEIALSVGLVVFLTKRYKITWLVVGVGALAFLVAQTLQIVIIYGAQTPLTNFMAAITDPIQSILIGSILVSVITALLEEAARYVGFRYLKEKGNSWEAALTVGSGAAGMETLLYVVLPIAFSFVMMMVARYQGIEAFNLEEAEAATLTTQMAAYWAVPWHIPFTTLFSILFNTILHLSLAVMVWQSVSRKQWVWLVAAILWHTAVDTATVFFSNAGMSEWGVVGVMAGLTLISIGFLYFLYKKIGKEPIVELVKPVK
jgi:uncharacterized membrane protein YhfC